MNEAEIQAAVESLLKDGKLLSVIEGKDLPGQVLKFLRSPDWLPSFPIDYLIRKRAAIAASRVLWALNGLRIVSTASKSISLATGETLYPDLLGCNPPRAVLAILELKADKQTERQAITELLAYDHEVRNHLPFLPNSDLALVVIATEFSPLLDHSLASLITWQRRNILCLRAETTTSGLQLKIHLPSCWTPLGQALLPPAAFRIARLQVGPRNGIDLDAMEDACLTALRLIAKVGERDGSHGFVMLCRDGYYPGASDNAFFFLVGLLDPYVFFTAAAKLFPGLKTTTPFAQFLLRSGELGTLSTSESPFQVVCAAAVKYLSEWCTTSWDGFTSWDAERDWLNRFVGRFELPRRGHSLEVEAWGDVGEYMQEMMLHPAIRQYYLPHFARPGCDWTYPPFAVAILDWMTLQPIFPKGQITCRGCFHLGVRLGRALSAYQSCITVSGDDYKNLPAFISWASSDLVEGFREVWVRLLATGDVAPPESIRLGGPKDAERSIESLKRRADWLVNTFIGPKYPIHQHVLQLGINAHVLYDDFTWNGTDEDFRQKLQESLVEASTDYLKTCLECICDPDTDADRRRRLRDQLQAAYGIELEDTPNLETAKQLVDALSDQVHAEHFDDALLPMLDEFVPLVFHRLCPIRPGAIDWQWFRDQIGHLRAAGAARPGIVLWPNGELATATFDHIEGPFPQVEDPVRQVIVCINKGFEHFSVCTWEELESGRLSSLTA